MKFDFNQIKNIAKDVSKEVVNVVGDKYLEIKANNNFNDGKYDEVIKTANEILKLDKLNYEIALLKGKALMKQNKYDEAIEAFIDALAIDRAQIEPLLYIASINELQGNIDDAIDVYESVIKKDNQNTSALLSLARNYYIKKEYKEVNSYFAKMESLDVSLLNDEDYYNWGISLKEMKKFENAKYKFRNANKLNPNKKYRKAVDDIRDYELQILKDEAYDFFNKNNYKKANQRFDKIDSSLGTFLNHKDFYTWGLCLEKLGNDSKAYDAFRKANNKKHCYKYVEKMKDIESKQEKASDELIKKALESYEDNDYKKANNYFTNASEITFNNISHEDFYIWGLCLMQLGKKSAAKRMFKEANKLRPCSKYTNAFRNELLNTSNINLIFDEAKTYFNKRDFKTSLEYLNKVLESEPNNVNALLLKAEILSEQHHPDRKIYYQKVLEIDPNNEKAKWALIAIEMAEEVSDPEKPAYWLNIGYRESLGGNYLNAIQAINKAIDIDPNHWVAWSRLCVAYQNINDYPRALDAINRSLEINSNDAQSWFNKGQTLFWLGNFGQSVECLNKAIQLDPNECDDALSLKGMALIRLNRMSEAKYSLRKSLEKNPENKFALETIKHIPNFVSVEVSTVDYIASSKINANPLYFSKLRHTLSKVKDLKAKGVNIEFQYSEINALLTYGSKKYFFEEDEIDGAYVFVNKLWEDKCK